MVRSLALLIASLFFSQSLWAATAQRGYSNYGRSTSVEANGIVHVYSGKTNNNCSENLGENSTCDSCKQLSTSTIATLGSGGFLSCNSTEIHPNLKFRLQLSSDNTAAYPGPVPCVNVVGLPPGGNATALPSADAVSYTVNGASQTVTATFKWGDICQRSDTNGDATCSTSFKSQWEFYFVSTCGGTTKVETGVTVVFHHRHVANSPAMGFDAITQCGGNTAVARARESVCHYTVKRGDKKVYLDEIVANNGSSFKVPSIPNDGVQNDANDSSDMKYAFLRLFYSSVSFNAVTTATFKDIEMNDIDPVDRRVNDLENGTTYFFVAANGDQGGNVTHFAIPGFLTNGPAGPPPLGGQAAIPAEVTGLLDGKKCFVATAAFGSPMAGEVEQLRNFRDQFLLQTSWGEDFVKFYYRNSPEWAAVIEKSDLLRQAARWLLTPVVYLSDMAMSWQMSPILGSLLFALGLFVSFAMGLGFVGGISTALIYAFVRWRR